MRSFRVDPAQGFFLNGRHMPLQGVSRHQDMLDKGWARQVNVEHFTAVRASDWCDSLPAGAYSVNSTREQRSTRQIPDGQTCQEVRTDNSGAPLFVVSDPRVLWVNIDAQEADAASLRLGAKVKLQVPSLAEQTFEATITAVTDQIDPNTRTIKIRAKVANPERLLKNEMLAQVHYQRQVGSNIEVPASAVFLRGNQHFVFVQSQAGVFEPRDVKVSYAGAQRVLLSAGLKEGEQVVSQNGLLQRLLLLFKLRLP